jgi:hypothetical protein
VNVWWLITPCVNSLDYCIEVQDTTVVGARSSPMLGDDERRVIGEVSGRVHKD